MLNDQLDTATNKKCSLIYDDQMNDDDMEDMKFGFAIQYRPSPIGEGIRG